MFVASGGRGGTAVVRPPWQNGQRFPTAQLDREASAVETADLVARINRGASEDQMWSKGQS